MSTDTTRAAVGDSALAATTWLIDPTHAYLNHGGFGALPLPVAQAAERIRAEVEANPSDVLMHRWQGRLDDVRRQVAEFLGGALSDLVFVPNATTGTATVVASLDLQPGDEVVTTDHRYPAVAAQVDALSAPRGVRNVETHVPVDASAEDVVARILGAVTDRTRLVVVDQIASPTGMVFPVTDLVAAVHAAGLPILVDAAHAPGQLAVDIAAIGADFWVGNLHKWVCSPRACAVTYVNPAWQDRIRPLVPSDGFAKGFQPAFDWTGTADPVPLLAVPAALDFWESLGWDDVRRTLHRLVTDGAAHIAKRLGTRVAIRDEMTAAMRLVELPHPIASEDGHKLSARLTHEHGVTAHVTHHAGSSYVRVCGQLYNRPSDYERCAEALVALLPAFTPR